MVWLPQKTKTDPHVQLPTVPDILVHSFSRIISEMLVYECLAYQDKLKGKIIGHHKDIWVLTFQALALRFHQSN